VDVEHYHPDKFDSSVYAGLPRPIWLNVGRVAVEKSLEDFLSLPLPGTKVIVGDGPDRSKLQRRFPDTIWRGWRQGVELAAHYASADCFVFPSRTETFGNVLLEAMASGLPVAAVPSPGPIDLIRDGWNGALEDSLLPASLRAVHCSRESARAAAMRYSWQASHETFARYLVPLRTTGVVW
jgi:glycosyltransferase involved in cell wall biosynthesis